MKHLRNIGRVVSQFAILIVSVFGCCGCDLSNPDKTASIGTDVTERFERPNVILFMADDLGWGDVGYAGSSLAVTPNLDEMAEAGVRLDQFYAAAPVCSPTRGSVLTGRHPYRYGIYFANVGHLPDEEITLAETLRSAGYRTGFFGKWHLGTLTLDVLDANRGGRPEHAGEYSPPWQHGFETVFATESKTPTFDPMIKPTGIDTKTWWDRITDDRASEPFGTHFWNEKGEQVVNNLKGDDSRIIVDRAIPFIQDAVESNTPFFVVIWTHAPHLPVVAGSEDREAVAAEDPYASHYFGSIHALDRQVGRIRNELRQLGIEDQTLFWFTSDNGPEHIHDGAPGSSGGLRGAKRSLYEGGIRVPGIVEWPTHIAPGLRVNAPAVTSDIYPTVLDYVGLPNPPSLELDGISLRSLLAGERTERGTGIGFESNQQIAWTTDRFKIIHRLKEPVGNPSLQGAGGQFGQNKNTDLLYEVYDLDAGSVRNYEPW